VQYGMEAESLGRRIGKPTAYGRELPRLLRETYPAFWRWSDGAESHAVLLSRLHTVFGWTVHVGPNANSRSLRSFPCQANGAEMLRLACSAVRSCPTRSSPDRSRVAHTSIGHLSPDPAIPRARAVGLLGATSPRPIPVKSRKSTARLWKTRRGARFLF